MSDKDLEGIVASLRARIEKREKTIQGLRSKRVREVFRRVAWIPPHSIVISNLALRHPSAVFNPGVVYEEGFFKVFPRLVIGYHWYSSAVGVFLLDKELLSESSAPRVLEGPFKTRVVVHPSEVWDIAGCEDPRVERVGDKYLVLYTGVSPKWGKVHGLAVQGYVFLDRDFNIVGKKRYFRLEGFKGGEGIHWWKDSAVLDVRGSKAFVLTRPSIEDIEIAWRAVVDLDTGAIDPGTLEPILGAEPWERKVGWSTNAVKISSNEYIVGWHGVDKESHAYFEGVAVVSEEGELLGVSDYLMEPRDVNEMIGDRPAVIFGCGLAEVNGDLYWFGGAADTVIGVYRAPLDEVLASVRWVRG